MKPPNSPATLRDTAASAIGRSERAPVPLLLLFLLLGLKVQAALTPEPVTLTLVPSGEGLQLSWPTQSVITNTGRTPIYPAYAIQASTDLAYWWDTTVVIPPRVGGPSLVLQTNFATVDIMPTVFLRVRSELNLAGADLSNTDFRGVDFSGENLSGTRFDQALLDGATFNGADLHGAQLTAAQAPGATFDDVQASSLTATSADLRHTNRGRPSAASVPSPRSRKRQDPPGSGHRLWSWRG